MAVFSKLPRSLKFRMTGVVVMLVLSATLIVTLMALLLAERDMRSVIGNQQYALLSSIAAQVDAQMESRKVLLASLADTMPPDAASDPAAMQAFIDRHPWRAGSSSTCTSSTATTSDTPRPHGQSAISRHTKAKSPACPRS
jgi:hypothetical protein